MVSVWAGGAGRGATLVPQPVEVVSQSVVGPRAGVELEVAARGRGTRPRLHCDVVNGNVTQVVRPNRRFENNLGSTKHSC